MGDEEAHLALPGRRVQARGAHGRSPPAWEPGARGAHLHSPPRALRPAGAFKRRSLAAKPRGRAKGWGRGLGGQPASRGSATAPDQSQDERQSRRPEPQAAGGSGQGERRGTPVPARRALALGLGWPRWGSTEAQTEGPRCPGVVLDSHPGDPPLPPRRRPWGPREVWPPQFSSCRKPWVPPGKKRLLGSSGRQLWEGTKATFIPRTGRQALGVPGGVQGPQVASHFREIFLLSLLGRRREGKAPRTVPFGLLE